MRAYIHIPFCRQKCVYCKFALTPFVRDAQISRYLGALKKEISGFFDEKKVDSMSNKNASSSPLQSLYFWGGTPSVLSLPQIRSVVELFRSNSSFAEDIEITFEANPEDISPEYAAGLLETSVNRLSFGVQTLNPKGLARVGRASVDTIFRGLDAAFSAGFENVNTDFILGLPEVRSGETLAGIRALHERFPLMHTSVYFLEKGQYPADWTKDSLDDESQRAEYSDIREYLTQKREFHHYEISNFARPGFESSHNRGYWRREECRGFGLSAASLLRTSDTSGIREMRRENAASFAGYYRGEHEDEMLSAEDMRLEEILCGMRTFSVSEKLFENKAALAKQIAL